MYTAGSGHKLTQDMPALLGHNGRSKREFMYSDCYNVTRAGCVYLFIFLFKSNFFINLCVIAYMMVEE